MPSYYESKPQRSLLPSAHVALCMCAHKSGMVRALIRRPPRAHSEASSSSSSSELALVEYDVVIATNSNEARARLLT